MYEILRVPHNEDQFAKAYELIQSFQFGIVREEFPEFYKRVKEIYLITDNMYYLGAGVISHKEYKNYEIPSIFNVYRDNIFNLRIVLFDEEDGYTKLYDLIKTIIRDSNDRLIMAEDVSNSNKILINALKNNKFRVVKGSNRNSYTQNLFYVPIYSKLIESELMTINPKDDLHTIDKMITFKCSCDMVAEAQERYTRDLLAKNIEENTTTSTCYCDECCYTDQQTEAEFMKTESCCYTCEEDW